MAQFDLFFPTDATLMMKNASFRMQATGKSIKSTLKSTDTDLTERLLKGNKKAQEEFYMRFAPKVLAICYRYLSDRDESEDAMIQSLLKALENISSFKAEGSLEGWVKRIAVNTCLRLLKNKAAFHVVSLHDIPDEQEDFVYDEPDTDYLLDLICHLPDGYRTVFNLYAIEGYSHAEISEMLGISIGTSKSQLSRARALLKRKIMSDTKKNSSNE